MKKKHIVCRHKFTPQNLTNERVFCTRLLFVNPFHWGINYWRQLPTKRMTAKTKSKRKNNKKKTRGVEKEKTQLKKNAATVKTQVLFKDKEKRGGKRSESQEPVAKRGATMLPLNSFGTRWQAASERNKQSTHFVFCYLKISCPVLNPDTFCDGAAYEGCEIMYWRKEG